MKKIFLFAFALVGILVSCNKGVQPSSEGSVVVSQPEEGQELFDVGVDVKSPGLILTKSDLNVTADESKYSNAFIFVYDKSTSALVDYKAWSGSSVKFSLSAGSYVFYAVLNGGTSLPSSAGTISNLLAFKSTLANDVNGFCQFGNVEKTIDASSVFSINVTRVTAKVVFNTLNVNFSSAVLQKQSLTVKSIFLINSTGDMTLAASQSSSTTYTPSTWYNKMLYTSGTCDKYLYAGGISQSIAHGGSATFDKVFYVYPNSTTSDAHNGSWSPRKTRIVVEATLNGNTVYYPLSFDSIASNKVYTIKTLTVTREGIDTPDGEWDAGGGSGSVTIGNWTEGGEYSEEL